MHRCYQEKKNCRLKGTLKQGAECKFLKGGTLIYTSWNPAPTNILPLLAMRFQSSCSCRNIFSLCRITWAGPNPTDTKGRPLNNSQCWYGLSMNTASLTIYSTSLSYHWATGFTLLGMALITFQISAFTCESKWIDTKSSWIHQIYTVQVWGGQQGEFRYMVWNFSDQWPGAVLCALRVKLCLAITQRPLQTIMTCLK